ncbi:hypothetical protein WJX73_000882 [Symbiochloris irregularis]|uniref:CBM20 domain-containing protein n=1 Tax=Symbiochloris irregularis TaxID=706552 RepID=A0AAW1P328_9CHLO
MPLLSLAARKSTVTLPKPRNRVVAPTPERLAQRSTFAQTCSARIRPWQACWHFSSYALRQNLHCRGDFWTICKASSTPEPGDPDGDADEVPGSGAPADDQVAISQMPPPKPPPVLTCFLVHGVAHLKPDSVHIVGNTPALGDWRVDDALHLRLAADGTAVGQILLPCTRMAFKVALLSADGTVHWELQMQPNRVMLVRGNPRQGVTVALTFDVAGLHYNIERPLSYLSKLFPPRRTAMQPAKVHTIIPDEVVLDAILDMINGWNERTPQHLKERARHPTIASKYRHACTLLQGELASCVINFGGRPGASDSLADEDLSLADNKVLGIRVLASLYCHSVAEFRRMLRSLAIQLPSTACSLTNVLRFWRSAYAPEERVCFLLLVDEFQKMGRQAQKLGKTPGEADNMAVNMVNACGAFMATASEISGPAPAAELNMALLPVFAGTALSVISETHRTSAWPKFLPLQPLSMESMCSVLTSCVHEAADAKGDKWLGDEVPLQNLLRTRPMTAFLEGFRGFPAGLTTYLARTLRTDPVLKSCIIEVCKDQDNIDPDKAAAVVNDLEQEVVASMSRLELTLCANVSDTVMQHVVLLAITGTPVKRRLVLGDTRQLITVEEAARPGSITLRWDF